MEFEELKSEDISSMYDLMRECFPPEERRIYQRHQMLYDSGCFEVYGKKDNDGKVVAAMSVWKLDNVRYVEHLAVKSDLRGQGIGRELVKWVFEKENAPFVLEVELPENETAKKRIQFYEKLGMYYNEYPYLQPPFREGGGIIPLRFMTYPQKIDKKTYEIYKKMIHERIYFYFEGDL